MIKKIKLRGLVNIALLFLVFSLAGCLQSSGNSTPTNKARSSNTSLIDPSNTPSIAPTRTLLVTEIALTLTPQADNRRESYLFPSDIDKEIAEVIQIVLEERLSYSTYREERFFSYVLLKPLDITNDGIIKAYIFVMNRKYYVNQGKLIEGGGGDIPAALFMEEKENGWDVVIETPTAGQWGSSMREIFPADVYPLLSHSSPIPYEAIKENIIHQAEQHFGLIFDPINSGFPKTEHTPTPSIRILTLTPTPTLDLSSLEMDIEGRVNIRDDSLTIQVDLYPKVRRPFYKGLISSNWRVFIHKRRADNHYPEQNALIMDEIKESVNKYEFNVSAPLEELQNKFGDNRGFVYQVVDKTGEVFWQDEFYINNNLINQYQDNSKNIIPENYPDYVNEGLIIGFPNLLSNNISPLFLSDGNNITIKEPQGGFYGLHYQFGFCAATGITSTNELQELSENLVIELFLYQEDGFYINQEATVLSGEISGAGGVLQANFPHNWLDVKRTHNQIYYLRIADRDGTIYNEAYIHFFPNTP